MRPGAWPDNTSFWSDRLPPIGPAYLPPCGARLRIPVDQTKEPAAIAAGMKKVQVPTPIRTGWWGLGSEPVLGRFPAVVLLGGVQRCKQCSLGVVQQVLALLAGHPA